ncbi:FAD-dependent oxidoreductase [Amycolatopsis rhizosphaerae]|uniref:FAD-dependent oxidoreductase n=1 Tax=Amycolatopsis rhizosphaerae TaxID=2053003 RepID=A0A558CT01_9PSEU|nr:FAD-dependent monooxygenase [Amycolatopsis rhizosphaerae]TVT51876.1 FAD-dependent oxidoreductase [Amycolatopsis rhizosphaerae]
MRNLKILVSGASVAGPALAFWLRRFGCTVTVVEKAPALRRGGQAVDFKGRTHLAVLDRMGLTEEIRQYRTGGHDQTIVDGQGRALAVIPGEWTGGDIEIRRGDLARILYERTANDCEYLFGDSVRSLTDTGSGVDVTFDRAAPRTFDLVVGADGIHSMVRKLAFGPEPEFVHQSGYHYALAELREPLDWPVRMYNEPGRLVATGGPKAPVFFVFKSSSLRYDRYDPEQQRRLVIDAYRGVGWRTGEVLAAVAKGGEFYLDSISRVAIDRYASGRVVLLGDSAYGNTLGGFGTGLAMVGAYVLAGELLAADGDHRVAFRRYEEKFRPYAKTAGKSSAGPFLAPPTRLRMRMRNRMFNSPFLLRQLLKMTDRMATDITLEDYERDS